MVGRFAQLEISVIGCPLKATGFGDTVICTAPLPPDGAGDGAGDGDGDGEGAGVPLLFDRDGTFPVDTFDGDVGSTAPQSIVTSARTIEAMATDVRIRRRTTQDAHLGGKLHKGAPQ